MATTFNRSNILKSAWNLVKTQGLTLSQAMKQAWSEAKAPSVEYNICDKTGIKFIGSKRQKNHPEVSKLLAEASKLSSYFEVKEACKVCKGNNLSLEEALAFLKSIMNETSEEKRKAQLKKSKEIKEFWKSRPASPRNRNIYDEEDLDYIERRSYKSTFIESIIEK